MDALNVRGDMVHCENEIFILTYEFVIFLFKYMLNCVESLRENKFFIHFQSLHNGKEADI